MRNKYRIVTDHHGGYEAQIKYWIFPFKWFPLYGGNHNRRIEDAKERIEHHEREVGKIVWKSY